MEARVTRKYDALTKFLRETVANEKASPKVRMQASDTLNSIYSRHEHYAEKQAARAERREVRALGLNAPIPRKKGEETPTEAEVPELSPEDIERAQINAILGRIPEADPRA
jgi:hypothetical protein